jgi:Sir2- and TIR-associating SLOG family/SIR2-like domain
MPFELTRDQRRFIREYGEKVLNEEGALFIGAGVSRAAGFVDWKTLLSEIAEELELDIKQEHDLPALAQYHQTRRGTRAIINQTIIDEMGKNAVETPIHRILSRLPISTVWTSNYDCLLEDTYRKHGRKVEVKLSIANLAQAQRGRDVTVYKMHGCMSQPQDAVLTKDDYERYDKKRGLFSDSLRGDFVEKTFLFLGFSFTDPNIERILARVRAQTEDHHQRIHYWIAKRPLPALDAASEDEKRQALYEIRKAELQSKDLVRYGITTVWVDDYVHIPELLTALEAYVARKGVFVSGAAADFDPLGREPLEELSRRIGRLLMKDGRKLISGFGLGLGGQVVLGALHALYELPGGKHEDRILVRPFPGNTPPEHRAAVYRKHREDLLVRAGAVIVIAGNKTDDSGRFVPSPGVMEEVNLAQVIGKIVIPIGVTGHVAKQIWDEAMADPEKYLPGIDSESDLTALGAPDWTMDSIIAAVARLLDKCEALAAGRAAPR